MICQRCRTGIFSRLQPQQPIAWSASSFTRQLPIQRSQFRNYSEGKPTVSAPPPPPTPRQPAAGDVTAPAAVSSATPGVSQPFSTPEEVHTDVDPKKPTKPAAERPASSCPAGTRMAGLNYFKNKPEVLAKEDSEYPDWLWTLLSDGPKKTKELVDGVDPETLNKKKRRRLERKLAARKALLPPVIPIHHHATDITPAEADRSEHAPEDILNEAAESIEKRGDITKSARDARRKAIREANFLRGL